ncbi:MAG: SDR family NAD(P)-dependent oxidoreductase [Anaerolineae bacterium]|nr:SDR family NAD(P)-dependent oxidoreductase [Anaerolineae bacterium]
MEGSTLRSTVLITGATGGLGKALAAECAARGWDLFLTDVSEQALAPLVAGLERQFGVTVLYRAANLTDPQARTELWQAIDRLGLRFHFLCNVAGIDFEGPFVERTLDDLHTILRLNIESTVETTRHALSRRDRTRPLHILNVASLAAFYPMPLKAVYASSKRFLLDWSLALNRELREADATVTALCPAGMPSTPLVISLIDAQGLPGRLTTMNTGEVAARAIEDALRGRAICIPGLINQVLRVAGGMVPPQILAALIERRWRQSQKQAAPVLAARQHSPDLAPSTR